MPDSGIADGSSFTSSFWDDYVREQVVCTCLSTNRPTGVTGRCIYETDTNRFLVYHGGWVVLAEPTQSFTPSWTNVTTTGGTNTGWSKRSDGWCEFSAEFILGASSGVTGLPRLALPYTAAATPINTQFSAAFIDNSASNTYPSIIYPPTTTYIDLAVANASGSYVGMTVPSSTIPFTWTNPDRIVVSGRYRLANRHSY